MYIVFIRIVWLPKSVSSSRALHWMSFFGLNSDTLLWRPAGALFVRGKLNEESNLCYGEVRLMFSFLPEPSSTQLRVERDLLLSLSPPPLPLPSRSTTPRAIFLKTF